MNNSVEFLKKKIKIIEEIREDKFKKNAFEIITIIEYTYISKYIFTLYKRKLTLVNPEI